MGLRAPCLQVVAAAVVVEARLIAQGGADGNSAAAKQS
jgi:hypothetical protein